MTRVYIYHSEPEKPEFEIVNSFSQSYTMVGGQRCRDTDLNVIVYKNFNDPDLYKRVKEEHNRINGEPTELKIDLYKYEIENNEPYKTITIDYINDTVKIE
ncbi:hypothetical protein [Romboutsia ilealis]|uniref:hypothetical protein n=1 Tax=Romboutsia ilealis TaxID=1115758 RepID=UPI0026F407B5|nr:hypothetical protein [Romboutsia ilealis]